MQNFVIFNFVIFNFFVTEQEHKICKKISSAKIALYCHYILRLHSTCTCTCRFKMLSKTADNAYPPALELGAVNEMAKLKEFASLQNGDVEHELEEEETVEHPEVIPGEIFS